MKDIDQIAREVAFDFMRGANVATQLSLPPENINELISSIKSALAAYGDEMAKHMREDAFEIVVPKQDEAYYAGYDEDMAEKATAIRALPLPSEVTP